MKAVRLLLLLLLVSHTVFADTVIMKNGEKLKGLILDDYKDRITLSTIGGEKVLMKSDLKIAIYDSEVDALYKKAANLEKKNKHIKAYYTYEEILEIDSEAEQARNRMTYLENYLSKDLKNEFYEKLSRRKRGTSIQEDENLSRKLFDEVGFSLKAEEPYAIIDCLNEEKISLSKIDFTEKDRIVSVWGKKTAYMDVDEIACMLLEPGEVKLTIEREYSVLIPKEFSLSINPFLSKLSRLVGATILLKKTGFIVAKAKKNGPFYKTGIRRGDLICFVDGQDAKFMPYESMQNLIVDSRGDKAIFIVRRDVSFWKRESN